MATPNTCISTAVGRQARPKPEVLIISLNGKDTYTLDLTKLDHEAIAKEFKDVRPLVGYDVKATLKLLHGSLGVNDLPPVGHDVLVGAFVLNALTPRTNLDRTGPGRPGLRRLAVRRSRRRRDHRRGRRKSWPSSTPCTNSRPRSCKKIPKLAKLADQISNGRSSRCWPRMEYTGIQLDTKYLGQVRRAKSMT